MTRLLLVVVLGVSTACGGHPPPVAHHRDRPGDPHIGDTQVVTSTPAPAPTDAECDRLLDHTLELAVADKPVDARPDDAERAKIRGDARPGFVDKCHRMSRAMYECAIAATASTRYEACDQARSSSSTSNSSVAPGGMTPAAPRSP